MTNRKRRLWTFKNGKFIINFILPVVTACIVSIGCNYGNGVTASLVYKKCIIYSETIHQLSVHHKRFSWHRVVYGFIGKQSIKKKPDCLRLIRECNRKMKLAV